MEGADALLRRVGSFHAKPKSQSFGLHLPSNQTKQKCLKDFLQQEQWIPPPCPIPFFLGTGRIMSHVLKEKRVGRYTYDHILLHVTDDGKMATSDRALIKLN